MISSGASWLPRSDTHGNPISSANCSTRADFPIPGAPHMNTGLLGATLSNISNKSSCVDYNAEISVIIFIYFNEMIPPTKAAKT